MLGYIDAGTGSAIVGAIAAGTAGFAVVFSMYKLRFLALFSKKKRAELDALRARSVSDGDEADEATPAQVLDR